MNKIEKLKLLASFAGYSNITETRADALSLCREEEYIPFWNPTLDMEHAVLLGIDCNVNITPYPIYSKPHSLLFRIPSMNQDIAASEIVSLSGISTRAAIMKGVVAIVLQRIGRGDQFDERQNLRAQLEYAQREANQWKANHDNVVRRSRMLIERKDLPMERIRAFRLWEEDQARIDRLTAEVEELRNKLENKNDC